jgi:hypothetical protein
MGSPGLPMQCDIVFLRQGEEFLQTPGLAHQPVRVIHDHMPQLPRPDRVQQRIPPRTLPIPLPPGCQLYRERGGRRAQAEQSTQRKLLVWLRPALRCPIDEPDEPSTATQRGARADLATVPGNIRC